jgi:hypothetical protein
MAVKKLTEKQVKTYLDMLSQHGEDGLYRKAVGTGIIRFATIKEPDVELLEISDAFFAMFRRNGDEVLFTMGKVFRRAAHTLFRQIRKEDLNPNKRFLQMVK